MPDIVGDRINWNKKVDEFVCRLAYEGVPVQAIQRSLNLSAQEVQEIIAAARDRGAIAIYPRNDWPPSTGVDQREPSFFNTPMDDDTLLMACMQRFRITRLQAIVFLALIRKRECSRKTLHALVQSHKDPAAKETDIKIIDVTMCLLRKRFAGKFVIDTIWSIGYAMSETYRKKAAKMLLEYLDLNESYLGKIVTE